MRVGKRPRSISRRSRSAVPRARDLARDDVARSELVREALSSLVEKNGALAAERLREKERGVHERRGMELHELEIAERCSGAVRRRHTVTDRAGRIGRPLPEGRCPARGEQRCARHDRAAIGDRSDATVAVDDRARAVGLLRRHGCADARNALGEDPRDAVSGRGPACMDHPSTAVAALEPEPLVELDAELYEVSDPRGRLNGQHLDGARAAEAAPRTHGVLRVQFRRVVVTNRCRNAALGERAGRRKERAFRDEQDVRVARRAQCADEPRDAAPDDEEVGSILDARFPASLMVVFDSEAITSCPSLPRSTHPASTALPLRARRARRRLPGTRRSPPGAALGARPRAVPGRVVAPRRHPRPPRRRSRQSILRHLATKVDVREVAHLEQLGTWSDPGRHPERWELATAYLGLVPLGIDPSVPADTRWHPVDALPHDRIRPRRDRPRGPRAAAREALVLEHRLRARTTNVHARGASRRVRSRARLRGLRDEPEARAAPARCDRVDRRTTRTRPHGWPACRGVPFPEPPVEVTDPFAVLRPPT